VQVRRLTAIGWIEPGTSRRAFSQIIGSRKILSFGVLRSLPFALRYIRRSASFGVTVADFTPT
jgi:hypothetical protein